MPEQGGRGIVVGLLQDVLALRGAGWRSAPSSPPSSVLIGEGYLITEATLDERSRVASSRNFVPLHPELRKHWVHTQSAVPLDGDHLGAKDGATPVDWRVPWEHDSRRSNMNIGPQGSYAADGNDRQRSPS